MTAKQVNRGAVISFIVGVVFIAIAILIATFIPEIELSRLVKTIVEIILALPWVVFIVLLLISLVRGY